MDIGCAISLFTNKFTELANYTTQYWIIHIEEFMWEKDLVNEEEISDINIKRGNDYLIIEYLMKSEINGEEISEINRYHLQDIDNCLGDYILVGSAYKMMGGRTSF